MKEWKSEESKLEHEERGTARRTKGLQRLCWSESSQNSNDEARKAKNSTLPPSGSSEDEDTNLEYIGQKVAKYFDDELFVGTIKSYLHKLGYWWVKYDDGDSEEFELYEVQQGIKLFQKEIGGEKNPNKLS